MPEPHAVKERKKGRKRREWKEGKEGRKERKRKESKARKGRKGRERKQGKQRKKERKESKQRKREFGLQMITLDLITVFWVNHHQTLHKMKTEVFLDLILEIRGFGP